MPKIDAHQHFWAFDPVRDSWISPEMNVIARDHLPQDLEPLLDQFNFDGCIVVQSDEAKAENVFQLSNAAQNDFIKGVVGWVDFQSAGLEAELQEYKKQPVFKGFRHMLFQAHRNRSLMLDASFSQGFLLLAKYGFTYDLLILPDQLPFVEAFMQANPNLQVVLDHMAKPNIKTSDITGWKTEMGKLASQENLYCKMSGLVTEADWGTWTYEEIEPYLDVAFNAFGAERLMFGSDWPVCNLAGGYENVYRLMEKYISKLSASEQAQVWGLTASNFYGIN